MSKYDVVIVGGGISGLAALHYVKKLKPRLSVRLFEAESRLGGTIGTDHVDGFSLDWGPNGFLDREPLTLSLCDEMGLTDQLERANPNVSNRFILRKGKLRAVPMKPGAFLVSDILSLKGKLRVAMEPFAAKSHDGHDESIYEFGRRRIGKEAADYLIQPMVSGIFGGVAERMSLESCFPVMKEMESEYGSLLKAMIAKGRKARANGKKSGGPGGPGGWLTSFYGGLDTIINRFEDLYYSDITSSAKVTAIKKIGNEFTLSISSGESVEAKQVIMATPSFNSAQITSALSLALSESLASISYAPIAVVCLGFRSESVDSNLDGFGFLVPGKEKRRILGSIWTSSIFQGRAPKGFVQFRSMVGGDGDHESAKLNDSELISSVMGDLKTIMKINSEPAMTMIYRWQNGIPQYHIGHKEVMSRIERELKNLGNIYIAGNAYYGIGLNDCVKQSYKVVSNLVP